MLLCGSVLLLPGADRNRCFLLLCRVRMYDTFDVQSGNASWSKWTYESAEWGTQYGGSLVKFDGISLVTVHSAGHMVSGYQPERGFAVLSNYLAGNWTGRPITGRGRDSIQHTQMEWADAAELASVESE